MTEKEIDNALDRKNEVICIGKLEWNVIYCNINERRIKTFNLFNHVRFSEDVGKLLCKTNISKEKFSEKLHNLVMCYFWCKAEWEILIRAWCGGDGNEEVKVDIFMQLKWNWNRFVDYVWGFKKYTYK